MRQRLSSCARLPAAALPVVLTAAALTIAGAPGAAQPSRAVVEARTPPLSPAARDAVYALVANKTPFHALRRRSPRPPLTLVSIVASAAGSGNPRLTAANLSTKVMPTAEQIRKCEAGDPSMPPHIDSLKGKIGSGGYVVIDGGCFGDTGVVELVGSFPGGRLALTNQSWSHDAITAGIPSVSGVYEQTVKIRVVRGNVISNEVSSDFMPEMENQIAPPSMIVNLACPFDPGGCLNGNGRHFSKTDVSFVGTATNGAAMSLQGDDRWEIKPPAGWSVDSLDWNTNYGVTALGDDFMTSPATDTVFTMHWQNNYVTTSPGFLGTGLGNKDRYFAAVYAMTAHLVGPKGTWH